MITLKTSEKALDCIASYGFLSKKDCKGYLESTTLSPINERNITALLKAKDNAIVTSGKNCMRFILNSYVVNASTITAVYRVTAVNHTADSLSRATLTIKANRFYKDKKPIGDKYFPCEKAMGHIRQNESGYLNFYDFAVTIK